MQIDLAKVYGLRDAFIARFFGRRFLPYQTEVSNRIIDAVLHATGEEIFIEMSRQSGKTTVVVDTVSFLNTFCYELLGRELATGIISPQKEMSKTDFDRLKDNYAALQRHMSFDLTEANGNTLRICDPANVPMAVTYCFSLLPTSNNESKTLHVAIFEESQKINDRKAQDEIYPMLASTNGTKIFIGTAGYRKCDFWKGVERGQNVFKYDCERIISDRESAYQLTGEAWHLNYRKFLDAEVAKAGWDSDYVKTQYRLEWVLEKGMFVTEEKLTALRSCKLVGAEDDLPCYAGLDTAKRSDSTVLTVVRKVSEEQFEVVHWLEVEGADYPDQLQLVVDALEPYNVRGIICDATGPSGDFFPDMLRRELRGTYIIPYTFDIVNKDKLYKNFDTCIQKGWVRYPEDDTAERRKFERQMLDLEKEYRGNKQYMVCHHPDAKDARDDYCDSLAMALWGAVQYRHHKPKSARMEERRKPRRKVADAVTGY